MGNLSEIELIEKYHIQGEYSNELEYIRNLDSESLEEHEQMVVHFFTLKVYIKTKNIEKANSLFSIIKKNKNQLKKEISLIIYEILNIAMDLLSSEYQKYDVITKQEKYPLIRNIESESDKFKIRWISEWYYHTYFLLVKIGNPDLAIENAKYALRLIEKIDFVTNVPNISTTLAGHYALIGDYDTAIELLNKCIKINNQLNLGVRNFDQYFDLGMIYYYKGEIEKSEDSFFRGLEVSKNHGMSENIQKIANIFLGEINYVKLKYNEAIIYYKKALSSINDDKRYKLTNSYSYFGLIRVYADIEDNQMKNYYLQEFEDLLASDKRIKDRFEILFDLSKSIVLKTNHRITDKAEAQLLLKNILNRTDTEFVYSFMAMSFLAELLMEEFKAFKYNEVLGDLLDLINRLADLGKKRKIYPLLIRSLILQANLFLINGELEKGENSFDKAISLAKEKKLIILLKQAELQKQLFIDQIGEWQKLIDRNSLFTDRIELTKIDDYLRDLQKIIIDKPKTEDK